MNLKRWIARREPHWKQLEALLKRADKSGLKSLEATEIQSLASLYRSASADLARAKTHQVGETLTHSLQMLVSRSYNQIYQGARRQEWRAVWQFYRFGLPAVIQATWLYTALATFIFLLGGLIAWWFSWQDPSFMPLVVPENLIHKVRDEGELWMGSILGNEPLAATGIMVNNIGVSLKATAGGLTGGLFTTFMLAYNGALIGAIATLVGQNNLAYEFWAFVLPHGSLELPAIFLAGGAGFLLARALLFPGKYRRGDALKFYGGQAAQLVYGVVSLLLIAGTIEGFISPSPLVPSPVKYLLGLAIFTALMLYCSQRLPAEYRAAAASRPTDLPPD
jgi:uncharacterized membrane protein SpoIIM required for sporulation